MNLAGSLLVSVSMAASAGPVPAPQAAVRAMFAAFNRHDADAMAKLYADDARLTSSDFCAARAGRADVVRTYRELFARFPDIHDEVERVVAEGDQVAVRFVAISATEGQSFRLPIMTFLEVRKGLIVSDDSTFDTGGRPCTP